MKQTDTQTDRQTYIRPQHGSCARAQWHFVDKITFELRNPRKYNAIRNSDVPH